MVIVFTSNVFTNLKKTSYAVAILYKSHKIQALRQEKTLKNLFFFSLIGDINSMQARVTQMLQLWC